MMKSKMLTLVAASTVVLSASPMAQSSKTTANASDKANVTLVGCVEKNKSGGYWLAENKAASPNGNSTSTSAAPGTTASSGSTGSTTGTTGSAPAPGTTAAASDKDKKDVRKAELHGLWNLQNGHDLDRYVNQTIQVTGRVHNSTSGDEVKGTTGREMEARDFDVKSVHLIAPSCS